MGSTKQGKVALMMLGSCTFDWWAPNSPLSWVYVFEMIMFHPCPLEHTWASLLSAWKSMKRPPLLISGGEAPLSLAWIAGDVPGWCCPGIARSPQLSPDYLLLWTTGSTQNL